MDFDRKILYLFPIRPYTQDWIKHILEIEKKKRNIPLEVKQSGYNYYLYMSTTVWDKVEKKEKRPLDI